MPGIFISYRHGDCSGWARCLFADLARRFGADLVFMDTQEDIPRGAEFPSVLERALQDCNVLLALISPQWISCTCADGSRRLDAADDWVRTEIAMALRREILVVPVLLGGAPLPGEDQLPADLLGLLRRQAAEITGTRWDFDIERLIADVIKQTGLAILDDVSAAKTGIRLLEALIADKPAVADAVSRSKEVIENTYLQIARLKQFKTIHDSLHAVEFACLLPLEAGGAGTRLRPLKMRFDSERQILKEAIAEEEMPAGLGDELSERLESAATAFEEAMKQPGEPASERVVGALNRLLSGIPPLMDIEIARAAKSLNLDKLLQLMARVRDTLPATTAREDPELEPFVQGVDALGRLRDELNSRVAEHGLLQRLDSKLRSVCVAGTMPGDLAAEWPRIKRVRSGLTAPFSADFGAVHDDLVATESEIEAQLEHGDEKEALALVTDYFRVVSSLFRNVDTRLKEFCLQKLNSVGQPLKTVLEMC
jgi:hypothetical protein